MFLSSVIIAGGKRRCDVNATDAMDPSPHHVQLWPHMRASAAFSGGASGLRALRLIARSVGGLTFWNTSFFFASSRADFPAAKQMVIR